MSQNLTHTELFRHMPILKRLAPILCKPLIARTVNRYCCTGWCRINQTIYFCCPSSVFYNKTRKYDKLGVAPRTLVKSVLNMSSAGCNNERQSSARLSYSAFHKGSSTPACWVEQVLTSHQTHYRSYLGRIHTGAYYIVVPSCDFVTCSNVAHCLSKP